MRKIHIGGFGMEEMEIKEKVDLNDLEERGLYLVSDKCNHPQTDLSLIARGIQESQRRWREKDYGNR